MKYKVEINHNGTESWVLLINKWKLHREVGPVVIYADGAQEWWVDGKFHRDGDLPAFIWKDGTKWWYKGGLKHRDGDLPAVIHADGKKEWWVNGEFIRKEG